MIRSLIFSVLFYLWIAAAMILSLPFIFTYSVIYKLHHYWAVSVALLLKKIVGCDHKIEGLDNLPKEGGYVIASKHQSAWETIIAFSFLPKVVFVYKKELGYIPIYGWYNKAFRNIKVDRSAGGISLKRVVAQAKERVEQGHQVIIFPQGSRTNFGVEREFKPAIYVMYKEGLPVYPAALNSGNHWPKRGLKRGGCITWKFFPAIEPGLSREQFMDRLAAVIEVESHALNAAEHVHSAHCGCH